MILELLKKHALGFLLALAVVLAGHAFLQEHDARVIAEQTVKTAQVQIDGLQKQQTATAQAAAVQIATLQKQAATVRTPAQAIQAIPTLSDVPLNVRAVPGMPAAVTVDALPLFHELEECKQDAVNLNACSTELATEKTIAADKDVQITALKKKKGFWARLKKTAIDTTVTVGIGAALGYALHR